VIVAYDEMDGWSYDIARYAPPVRVVPTKVPA